MSVEMWVAKLKMFTRVAVLYSGPAGKRAVWLFLRIGPLVGTSWGR